MNQPTINQFQLTNELESLKAKVNDLSSKLQSHNHDGFTQKIDFKHLLFTIFSQYMEFVTLADNAELEIPQTYGIGMVMAGTVDEAAIFKFSTDGSVVLLANTTNVDDADTDGDLCIYDAGTKTKIKNRLGSTKEIRYIIFS